MFVDNILILPYLIYCFSVITGLTLLDMIRIYFDSDVINNIRSGRLPGLAKFIEENRSKLLIPYSQAHVSDKLPSKDVNEELFYDDIDYITQFTESKLITYDDKKGHSVPCIASAREVLEDILDTNNTIEEFSNIDNIISFIEDTAKDLDIPSMGEMFKGLFDLPAFENVPESMQADTYKEQLQKAADYMSSIRNDPETYKKNTDLIKDEFGLPAHSGQWVEGVIDKVDTLIGKQGKFDDFTSLVDNGFDNKKNLGSYNYYIQSYLMLNLIGYKSDEINVKRNKGMPNHLQDAMHSYYGGHCDYFVAMDKKLTAKTNALFEKFKVSTKVFHPYYIVEELTKKLEQYDLVQTVKETLEKPPVDTLKEDGIIKGVFRIEQFWLNYFTHLQQEVDSQTGRNTLLFTKMYSTYSNFMFYEEHDSLISSVHDLFGVESEKEKVIERFKVATIEERFIEYFLDSCYVKLSTTGSQFYLWIVLPAPIQT